jgi:photosystem II stability/assembly factor-like uncharacterized protein
MKHFFSFWYAICLLPLALHAQHGWSVCNAPLFNNRVDDIFMADAQIGYAVCGDGKIVKTIDGGANWLLLDQDDSVYCRSVEFPTTQKGFVGGFPSYAVPTDNILRKTTDGGTTWTDLTPLLAPYARNGICGLAAPDSNTIYGCGNWYNDTAYIVKSVDGGATWTYIDMQQYATSLIDMYFISKDTGFATGAGPAPLETAVILYTTDGGVTWTYQFQNTVPSEYCWKIQRLDELNYFASIEDFTPQSPSVLRSVDGGMSWTLLTVQAAPYNIEGVGFIDSLHGWTGGGFTYSFETQDGGQTWDTVQILQVFNRFFRLNDSVAFATGFEIWKYNDNLTGIHPEPAAPAVYSTLSAYPTPANDVLHVNWTLAQPTRAMLVLYDASGRMVMLIENANKPKGEYQSQVNTSGLAAGSYSLVLKTHEDKQVQKVVIAH